MSDNFAAAEISFARTAKKQFKRLVVFQRLPTAGEDQQDARGFPLQTYTNIDAAHPIPCTFIVQAGREVSISNSQRHITPYKITIPVLYESEDEEGAKALKRVDFSTAYRAHILEAGSHPELFLQVFEGGSSEPGPDITFSAYLLENTV